MVESACLDDDDDSLMMDMLLVACCRLDDEWNRIMDRASNLLFRVGIVSFSFEIVHLKRTINKSGTAY